jgi:hypothetical protein
MVPAVNNPIPTPLRAVAGLAAATIDEAKRLPTRLVGLPVLAVSTALQTSLKFQQHYADLVIRGDELLAQLRPEPAEPPSWATFDDDSTEEPVTVEVISPIPGYDELSVPQLRARLRQLSEAQLVDLLEYEQTNLARAPYLTMLANRLETVRSGAGAAESARNVRHNAAS